MASALRISTPRPVEAPAPEVPRGRDELDRLDFDAWLLAPPEPDRLERCVRAVSVAAGPAAFCALAGAVFVLTA